MIDSAHGSASTIVSCGSRCRAGGDSSTGKGRELSIEKGRAGTRRRERGPTERRNTRERKRRGCTRSCREGTRVSIAISCKREETGLTRGGRSTKTSKSGAEEETRWVLCISAIETVEVRSCQEGLRWTIGEGSRG